ncbi:30S ribosomal protein S15 [Texas Phoenix palm phytoplasma]|uniref:30S ribosomal protein S15 n=1 Tax=Texas Phoenix palm phytoplasma TaxID=176709 RepID=A0ABS5BIU6_9MOLU|nr:30S ribosomal protein S15 [Texas Phoenix palm phytoplasma]MBP3059261.1 30S ribosomal protein S15 [Texas Phoenix palm phytoplasma]
MALNKNQKKEIFKKHKINEKNTGCTEFQIALLCKEMDILNKHLKKHPSDFHSKRGLLTKNQKKKTLINYNNKKNKKIN